VTERALREFAPAKINLALHVTGRRGDGYHLLDSIVVFADIGDWLDVAPGEDLSLTLTGPRAEGVPVEENLVLRAAAALRHGMGRPDLGANLTLDKHLPAAAGIGGGSSDAAAALRALNRLWDLGLSTDDLRAIGYKIGADVPVCLVAASARVQGIGERITLLPGLPEAHLVLVNPGRALATAAVFAGLSERRNPVLPPPPERWGGVNHLAAYLGGCRNDLAAPAIVAEPAIGEVLEALGAAPGCLIARMSGSGATCFGLFATADEAAGAAARLARQQSQWWITAARVL
jgi:4-diphosphocytidyl-2-C-methyl-D-erythritol kinase